MEYTVLFLHGRCIGTSPPINGKYYDRRDIIYGANTIISDGKKYDLTNKDSIYSIAIPSYDRYSKNAVSEELGVTGYLEYVLKMRASGYKNSGNNDLCYACLGMATYLMAHSTREWNYEDYFRISDWLERDGRYNLAERWVNWIHDNVPSPEDKTLAQFRETLKKCEFIGTDLIELAYNGGQCGTVAKYQGRVYSITGKDRDFPILPAFIKRQGAVIPPYGGASFFPFVRGVNTMQYRWKEVNPMSASWRPFVDDRTKADKEAYASRYIKIETERIMKENGKLYDRIKNALPDICPKSISTFYRWQEKKPEKYAAIVSAASALGLSIPEQNPSIEVVEPPDPAPNYCGK
jgi:hypothetical protein